MSSLVDLLMYNSWGVVMNHYFQLKHVLCISCTNLFSVSSDYSFCVFCKSLHKSIISWDT